MADTPNLFVDTFDDIQTEAHRNSAQHGFWREGVTTTVILSKLALIHSEVSETLEIARDPQRRPEEVWYRHDGKPEGMGPEMADIVIRVMDLAEALGIPLAERILQKQEFNRSRPHMHGKTA